jgi:hypothetical protein
MTISDEIRAFKYKLIKGALELHEGNVRKTARALGCSNQSLCRWMRELNLANYAATMRRKRDWWLAEQVAAVLVFAVLMLHGQVTHAQASYQGPFNPQDVKAAVVVPEIATNLAYFPLYTLNVAPVPGASIQLIGPAGQATWYLWASANFPLGSVVSFLGSIQNAPNTLSMSNYVAITPTAYPAGATSVDILATKSSVMPSGACNCAVATGLTSGAANFQSNTTSSYTATALDASVYGHTITVEGIGHNTAHAILRENGLFVCDLDVGCGNAPGAGYIPCDTGIGDGLNAIPAGTYLQSFCFNDSGSTLTLTGLRCFTDNNGSSTLNATNSLGASLLTGPITCSNSFAAGTQSSTVTLLNGQWIEFTFVADGTSKQTTWTVTQ